MNGAKRLEPHNLCIQRLTIGRFVLKQCVSFTSLDSSANVLGSMLGKRAKATGKRNSMKGTMMKTEKGTKRNMSAVVRTN